MGQDLRKRSALAYFAEQESMALRGCLESNSSDTKTYGDLPQLAMRGFQGFLDVLARCQFG